MTASFGGVLAAAVRDPFARVLALCALLGAGALALQLLVVPLLPAPAGAGGLPWLALAALFAATEVFVVHAQFRRDAHSFTLNEIPLLLALAFAAPWELLSARLIGSGAALVFHRQQRGVKLAVNLAWFAFEAALATTVYRLLLDGQAPTGVGAWQAGLVTTVLCGTLASLVVLLAIAVYERPPTRAAAARTAAAGVATALMNGCIGLVAVQVLWFEPRAGWLLGALAVVLFAAYRSYARLQQRHEGLEEIYAFTQAVAQSVEIEPVVTSLVARARQLLRAEIVELVVYGDDGTRSVLTADESDAIVTSTTDRFAAWDRVIGEDGALLLTRNGTNREHQRLLRLAHVREAMIAPLQSEDGVLGAVRVANDVGTVRSFSADDLRLLQTLANHTSVALRNGRLVDRLRAQAAQSAHEALHDALTGLPNRRCFNERVDEAIAAARGSGREVAVMLLDLDRFKEVNDTLGHDIGDLLLKEIGPRLADAIGRRGVVARLGGDEFAVLLPDVVDDKQAMRVARQLRVALARPLELQTMTLNVEASVGIALYPEHASDARLLLQRADVAMYRTKSGHREPQIYAAEHDQYSARRLSLIGELRGAIDEGQLVLHYQPQVDLGTGTVLGVEALVRWQHPRFGLIPPDEFVAAAEHTELLATLTRFVLDEALAQRARWAADGLEVSVAVNLSARSLLDESLPTQLTALLTQHCVPARALTLELTESTLMVDAPRAIAVLRTLAAMGVGVAIDDYGTGYSSLSYLKQLPLHELKIDKSFVMHYASDDNDAMIVRSTIDLAHNLGLRVVAEGVEDAKTLRSLRTLGCDVAQGFYLSRPLTAARVAEWAARWRSSPAAPVFALHDAATR